MTRIVLLAAIILSAIPLHAESHLYKPADGSREAELSNIALPYDDQVQETGQEADERTVALNKNRLKEIEIESIIKDLQQTRSELKAQIEIQRQQVIKLEEDIAKIVDYMRESRLPSSSEGCSTATSAAIQQTTDTPNLSATLSEKIETDPEEGWIRNEATGDTISLRHGMVSLADRGGRPIDRPTQMLTMTRVHAPDAPFQVGNLDVTFSPRVSNQVKMAFLNYPTAPAQPARRNELYTGTANKKYPVATPAPQLAVAAGTNGRGEILKIKVGSHSPAHSTSSATNHRPGRSLEPIHLTGTGAGKRKLHPAIVSNQNILFTKGIPGPIGQWHNQRKTEKITEPKPAETGPAVNSKEKVAILKLHERNGILEIGYINKEERPSVLYNLEG